jgi:hypothetical protein
VVFCTETAGPDSASIIASVKTLRLAGAVLLAAGCGQGTPKPPTAPTCQSFAGTYVGTFTGTACGKPTQATVVVEQDGCEAFARLGGLGALTGDVDETSGAWVFELVAETPCFASAVGTASVIGTTISGRYSGTMAGTGCCPSLTVDFTLVRQ